MNDGPVEGNPHAEGNCDRESRVGHEKSWRIPIIFLAKMASDGNANAMNACMMLHAVGVNFLLAPTAATSTFLPLPASAPLMMVHGPRPCEEQNQNQNQ